MHLTNDIQVVYSVVMLKQRAIRMSDRMWDRAKWCAEAQDQSVTEFVRSAVRKHCDDVEARRDDAGKRGSGRNG